MQPNSLDHVFQNQNIKDSIKTSIEELFPISSNGKKLVMENVIIDDNLGETDYPRQKEVKLSRGS